MRELITKVWDRCKETVAECWSDARLGAPRHVLSGCWQASITDAAFVHLTGIHTLFMDECNQAGITDAAFVHLKGIHKLNMSCCDQAGITDAAFVHLKGIHTLDIYGCSLARISPTLRAHLRATVPVLLPMIPFVGIHP